MKFDPLSREEIDTKYQVNYIIEACSILDGSSFAQSVSKELIPLIFVYKYKLELSLYWN